MIQPDLTAMIGGCQYVDVDAIAAIVTARSRTQIARPSSTGDGSTASLRGLLRRREGQPAVADRCPPGDRLGRRREHVAWNRNAVTTSSSPDAM